MKIQDPPILLYDIDGTLLKVHREFLFRIIEQQLQSFDIPIPDPASHSFAGRTDRGIFMELIGSLPDAETLFPQLKSAYSNSLIQQLTPAHIDLCEGAVESVHEAVNLGYSVGLCTGNFRQVAFKKVETAGLQNIFTFGGFGEISVNRNHLPGGAHQEYCRVHGEEPHPARYVIIGDTPNDIRCAKYFGAKSVAVTTGGFTRSELHEYQPDLILDSLDHPSDWLRKLGFNA